MKNNIQRYSIGSSNTRAAYRWIEEDQIKFVELKEIRLNYLLNRTFFQRNKDDFIENFKYFCDKYDTIIYCLAQSILFTCLIAIQFLFR